MQMAAATTERRCYIAKIDAGGCYHRRRRLLPSTPVAATIDDIGCYHQCRRLLPSTPASATIEAGV
jgi:hypothetical protein